MNTIIKRASDILKNNRLTKSKKIVLENTIKFSKKYDVNIVDCRVDFLTIKIEKGKFIKTLEMDLYKIYSYDDIFDKTTNLEHIECKKTILNKFFIIFTGLAFGEQKKVYSIFDKDKNKIGQIVLKNEKVFKRNNNVINTIEFKGLFFKCYYDDLEKFYSLLEIDKNGLNIIKRIDYCLDLAGLEVFELTNYLKSIKKKSKNINAITGSDKKKILDYLEEKENKKETKEKTLNNLDKKSLDIKYGTQETYINYTSKHNDLKIYDKILDVLDQHKKTKINGKNPYQSYLNSNVPITRIELSKKKFDNLTNNSINWVFDNIDSLFFDYLLWFFEIDLSLYKGENLSLNGKKSFLAKEKKQKNLYHSMIMAQAYLKNIEELTSKEVLFRFLFKLYPDLEKTKALNLITTTEIQDYFYNFNNDIIGNPELYNLYLQRDKGNYED